MAAGWVFRPTPLPIRHGPASLDHGCGSVSRSSHLSGMCRSGAKPDPDRQISGSSIHPDNGRSARRRFHRTRIEPCGPRDDGTRCFSRYWAPCLRIDALSCSIRCSSVTSTCNVGVLRSVHLRASAASTKGIVAAGRDHRSARYIRMAQHPAARARRGDAEMHDGRS